MTVVQALALVVVAVGGGAVVLAGEPLRQALVLGVYGVALSVLFFAFQAPDVALSQIVVSAVGLPIIVLAALRKIGKQEREQEREGKARR